MRTTRKKGRGGQNNLRRRALRITTLATQKIKRAMIGATLSLSERDGPGAPIKTNGFAHALELAAGNADLVCEITTSWCLNWEIKITVECQQSQTVFYEQDVIVTAKNQPIKSLSDLINQEIAHAKSLCNQKHIINCSWVAVITE